MKPNLSPMKLKHGKVKKEKPAPATPVKKDVHGKVKKGEKELNGQPTGAHMGKNGPIPRPIGKRKKQGT